MAMLPKTIHVVYHRCTKEQECTAARTVIEPMYECTSMPTPPPSPWKRLKGWGGGGVEKLGGTFEKPQNVHISQGSSTSNAQGHKAPHQGHTT